MVLENMSGLKCYLSLSFILNLLVDSNVITILNLGFQNQYLLD